MANPTARQRSIGDLIVQAASPTPLWFARSAPVEQAFTSAGIPWQQVDANYGYVETGSGAEALARAIEALRVNGQSAGLDALFRGEQQRRKTALDAQAQKLAADAAAAAAERDAAGAVVFP